MKATKEDKKEVRFSSIEWLIEELKKLPKGYTACYGTDDGEPMQITHIRVSRKYKSVVFE